MTDLYPYFIYPDVVALKDCQDENEAMRLRRRIAANVGDTTSLRIMLGMDPEEFSRFYPDMAPTTLSTNDTIDTFLARFGQPDAPVSKATAEIGTDYAGEIAGEDTSYTLPDVQPGESVPADSTTSAIDSFLASVPAENASGTPLKEPETESDVRILIKNHDYQTALEIIMRLRLNNPEKSIYFADQIRFLRKLILNQAKQNNDNS